MRLSQPHITLALFLLVPLVIGWTFSADGTTETGTYACCAVPGDVNHSNTVDISDITRLVEFMFLNGAPLVCEVEADMTSDNAVDISDLTFLVNFLFLEGPSPGGCPPLVQIVGLQPFDGTIAGTAEVPDTSIYQVVLWAKTDRWYIQPLVSNPYTPIQGDGSWFNVTNPWNRIVALLVDTSYIPGSVRDIHPSSDAGVVDWDEYPEKHSARFIEWSGYQWRVKQAELAGPGPNYFSDDAAHVWVDEQDGLHLKIGYQDTVWRCAEVVLDTTLGYGTYTFKLDSRVDSMDANTIFAGFVFDTTAEEFDFEFSQRLASPLNAQFVVQPWYLPGNIETFSLTGETRTSFSVEWRADRIVFTSWTGHADTTTPATVLHTWTYLGASIPDPGDEHWIFNLYLFGGEPPTSGIGEEVIVNSFQFAE